MDVKIYIVPRFPASASPLFAEECRRASLGPATAVAAAFVIHA